MILPKRRKIVNGHKVAEYYWNGKMVVYIDNKIRKLSFEDACAEQKNRPNKQDGSTNRKGE